MFPILTYHSAYISGADYTSNDHIAFRSDLRLVHKLGFRIASLEAMVERMLAGQTDFAGYVVFTMDDGTNFDYYDLPHPTWGVQRSMLNIMNDFVDEFGRDAQPGLHATSFVIVSPAAREELDRSCLIGHAWYSDEWWAAAIASGLMGIANHSWDHNHGSLQNVAQRYQDRGTFQNIDTYNDADAQIRQASDYLAAKTHDQQTRLFAYPYGEVNEYLARSYFPDFPAEHKMHAAFATDRENIAYANGIWTIPRLVFRQHWQTSDELAGILLRERSGAGTHGRSRVAS